MTRESIPIFQVSEQPISVGDSGLKVLTVSQDFRAIVKIGKLRPFKNVCPVTGKSEDCNVEVTYVPSERLLELQSFRDRMARGFSCSIEALCATVLRELVEALQPGGLVVEVFLVDADLTPWSVQMAYGGGVQ